MSILINIGTHYTTSIITSLTRLSFVGWGCGKEERERHLAGNGRRQSSGGESANGRKKQLGQAVQPDSRGDRADQRVRCPATETPSSTEARDCPKATGGFARPVRRAGARDDETSHEILQSQFDPRTHYLQVTLFF